MTKKLSGIRKVTLGQIRFFNSYRQAFLVRKESRSCALPWRRPDNLGQVPCHKRFKTWKSTICFTWQGLKVYNFLKTKKVFQVDRSFFLTSVHFFDSELLHWILCNTICYVLLKYPCLIKSHYTFISSKIPSSSNYLALRLTKLPSHLTQRQRNKNVCQ